MANPISLTFHEKIYRKNIVSRVVNLIILFLLLSLLSYRILSLKNHGFVWVAALMCESWFSFVWILIANAKWSQVDYKTYPDRLLQWAPKLPPVDMFVTTADPVLEPPILTVDTVLSLLSVDYPTHKLACYVSDDSCSPLIYYSIHEASKFAKLWVPFCKKYNVQLRAPFRYFSLKPMWSKDASVEFQQEWQNMKDEYEQLSQKIEVASQSPLPCGDLTGEFAVFSNIERRDHPTIVKVFGVLCEAQYFQNVMRVGYRLRATLVNGPSARMLWILGGPECLNARNITEVVDSRFIIHFCLHVWNANQCYKDC